MTNFVLVHGAWGSHLTWGEVPQRLEAAGHSVLVATLPGLGVRQDELHPGITLSDHIDAVCAQIEAAGIDRFVLAGHSYGGSTASAMSMPSCPMTAKACGTSPAEVRTTGS